MTVPLRSASAAASPSGATRAPVTAYRPPFEFTGTILKVTADVSGKMIQDTEEEGTPAKAAMARQ